MNLTEELQKFADNFAANAPEEIKAEMQKGHDELISKKIASQAIGEGDHFPAFSLSNQKGENRSFDNLFTDNRYAVISFYRGGWCPYCNLELRALQQFKGEFKANSASLVALTPEKPDHSLSTAEKNELDFEVLSDVDSTLAADLGLAFELPDNLKPIYANFGINLPEHNGENNFTLPVPATYIVDKTGLIHYAFINLDYRLRAEPEVIVEKLKSLNTQTV